MRNQKKCVVCGEMFFSPPSAKTITCSPECRSVRASRAAKAARSRTPESFLWSEETRKRRASDERLVEKLRENQRVAVKAAMAIPEGQRGPQNRTSKHWILLSPGGQQIEVKNLQDWARKNYTIFEPDCDDPEKAASRISGGFKAIAGYMRGVKSRTRPVTSYKGWGLYSLPDWSKEDKP